MKSFESMRPFIIKVVVCAPRALCGTNQLVKIKWNFSDAEEKREIYAEVSVDDGDYKHYEQDDASFEGIKIPLGRGEHTLCFRGNMPGILIRDSRREEEESNCNYNYYFIDVCQWGDICWRRMKGMFKDCRRLEMSATDAPNLQDVDEDGLEDMFSGASLFNSNIEHWDITSIHDLSYMFHEAVRFNQPLGKWKTENVRNMKGMFKDARCFNQPIEAWNVGNVTDMSSMFYGASMFNQPIGSWNVSNVTDMAFMFEGALSFNQPIGAWNVGKVKNMCLMFCGASAFNQPIGSWNVGNVTDMVSMFQEAHSFNQPIGSWNVGNVTDMAFMFGGAHSFNQPIGFWNVSNVTDMSWMFHEAYSFNQPIGSWNVGKVMDMSRMFDRAYQFEQSLEQWHVSQVLNMDGMFDQAGNGKHIPVTWVTRWLFVILANQLEKGAVFSQAQYRFLEQAKPVLYVLQKSGVVLESAFLHDGVYVWLTDHPECIPQSICKEILTSMPDAWVHYEKERKELQGLNPEEMEDEEMEDEDMYCRMANYAKKKRDIVVPYSICIQDGIVKLVERESYDTVED